MTGVEVAPPNTALTGLSANWVEDLLRKEQRTVEEVWLTTFNRSFKAFLSDLAYSPPGTVYSRFESYIVHDFALTPLRVLYFNLRDFRNFSEVDRAQKWKERYERADQTPPMPAATPFNCAAHFLEFYFVRLINALKLEIVDFLRVFLATDRGIEAVPAEDRRGALLRLSVQEGAEHSFDLIPLFPLESRSVRTLRSEDCGQLVLLSGVVTRISDVKPELRFGAFQCQACNNVHDAVEQQFKFTEPTFCWTQACGNRTKWNLNLETSIFGDWQKLRIQQSANDDVPAGSVPRCLDAVARGPAVERCKPGDRVAMTGCLLAVPDVPALMKPAEVPKSINTDKNRALQSEAGLGEFGIHGLTKLGVRELSYKQIFLALHISVSTGEIIGSQTKDDSGSSSVTATSAAGRLLRTLMALPGSADPNNPDSELATLLKHPLLRSLDLTAEQHKRFKQLSLSLNCLDRLVTFMAPEVFGAVDVKKGLLLMLVGGVEKYTRKDSIKLRGDINVCLVGDPGTAKSQLLKFVQSFAERAIFTSGKSSTAAGLTASVHKDPEQGESVVEAGALILADNGVCCIDEFDKMADKDMVAIHEAMEQQTISISKAGVQATMNARASVLAACNPIGGRYDVTRRLRENLKLSPTILSRFDLIFVLLDRASDLEDRKIAAHVLGVGSKLGLDSRPIKGAVLKSVTELKLFVKIAKAFRPKLTQEAKSVLVRQYVSFRQRDAMAGEKRSMRVTVRQLESMLRLAEAAAKLQFSNIVTKEHADTAVQLFGNCLTRVKSEPITLIDSDDENGESPRGQITLDSDLFEVMQSQILNYIRSIEHRLILEGGDPAAKASLMEQKTRPRLVQWYVEEFHSDLCDEEDIDAERRKLHMVLSRTIRNGVIFEETQTMDSEEQAVLRIHPNLEIGSAVLGKTRHQNLATNFFTNQEAAPEVVEPSSVSQALGLPTVTFFKVNEVNIADGDFLSLIYQQ